MLNDIHSQVESTTSALEVHKENLRKQEEEKQRRIEEAKKKGKSSHDEVDMLAVLLIEEQLGQLHRDEDEFVKIYSEDFAAYNEGQLKRLRKKVMPTIHDDAVVESAKEDMLSRTVDDRFSISTGNYFNVSTDWDFEAKGKAAIEATKLWYRESEMSQLRQKMEDHKEQTCQSVASQLSAFRPEWTSFNGLRGDLHISIANNDEEIPEAHNLFHVILNNNLHVWISLNNPSMGYITIPVMNVFASCWKVTPEAIWDAALLNKIEDGRGNTSSSRSDALTAKVKALSRLKAGATENRTASGNSTSQSVKVPANSQPSSNPNDKRINQLKERIAALRREADSIHGIFGFMKKNRINKEISELEQELRTLQ